MTKEFFELSPVLQLIICDINKWAMDRGESVTWTSFYRSQEEQLELVDLGYTKVKNSVHMYHRGADFRPFKNNNLNLLVADYINDKYPYGDGKHKTLFMHEGTAYHGHVQCKEG